MAGSIAGQNGAIKWAYYTAAAVQGYRITRAENGVTTLVATVVHQDRFNLTRRPLIFEAPHKQGAWRWPIVDFTIAESGRLVARLGAELPG